MKRGVSMVSMEALGKLEVDPTDYQRITRRGSVLAVKAGEHFVSDDDSIVDEENCI